MPDEESGSEKKLTGLTEEEALARLRADGFNELQSSNKHSVWKIITGVIKEPMIFLLLACGGLYSLLGDIGEACMLLGFVFIIIGITVYQEGKAEKALEALKDLSSPRAIVLRNGMRKRIPGKEVVKGDVIILTGGDRVPADAVLLWGMNLTVDESILTGESVPVRKEDDQTADMSSARPGGDGTPFLFSGSLVVQGEGVARVERAGTHTEMGKIGKVLGGLADEKTLLQKETAELVKKVFIAAIVLCFTIFLIYGTTRGNWVNAILSSITLAMALLPEEFPVILTVFMAIGAWRISRKNVLTRKVAAVESLGSATVLCVDKTGTLTENKMTVKKIYNGKRFYDVQDTDLPEVFHELVEYGILASKKDPSDPMEKALEQVGQKFLSDTEHLHDWELLEEYPLSKEMMALSHVWEMPDGGYIISAKGAPEAIQDLCHMPDRERKELSEKVNTMAKDGLRVLGVAKAFFRKKDLPKTQHDFEFTFLGLVGLADPVRKAVPSAVKECYNAGIRVVMITGDYPATAQNIAKEIGFQNVGEVITGSELDAMGEETLKQRVKTVNIFSRVVPEQKLRLVRALKANGEVVAMTGDGVNDAPALKAADIGVAMGERGTDVAREAADLVLTKDDFSSLVGAIEMGRRIFDNLRKALAYVISVHVPIAGVAMIPVICGWPVVLYPMHVVFLELIIDPACSVVFEAEKEEDDIMARKPRDPKEKLFGKRLLSLSVMQGVFSLLVVMAVFRIALNLGQGEESSRALAFTTLIFSNICLILTNRSWEKTIARTILVKNEALGYVVGGAFVFLFAVMYVPFLRELFHFGPMHFTDFVICIAAGLLSVMWFEFMKVIFRKTKIAVLS
jgi:Ca2+-transporting ATPase